MSDAILDAFRAGVAAGESEDQIKLSMIQAGDTFKTVAKNYAQFLIDEGIVESKESKDEKIASILSGADLSTEEGFASAVAAIVAAVKGVDEKSAAGSIRWYARKNDIAYFTKPKAESTGRAGFAKRFYEALIANPEMSKHDAEAIIQGIDGNPESSDNVKKHASHYQSIRKLANAIANGAGYDAEGDDDSDEDLE
jgi:hypothetical protein